MVKGRRAIRKNLFRHDSTRRLDRDPDLDPARGIGTALEFVGTRAHLFDQRTLNLRVAHGDVGARGSERLN
ncbi:MAG: hypothetical protein A2138_12645 [Deltaproteobacteria bacterium RBG_16_71_12]|nr:MAG: hypothetical protein A2138_12645 [Deltaproteobacteria bacterium RBG_16_71_12]